MKISNLRIERHLNLYEGVNLQTRVICDVECAFCKARELYFSVDDNYGDWLTADVYDAFLVAALYPAMYYKEPIEVEGCVSKNCIIIFFIMCLVLFVTMILFYKKYQFMSKGLPMLKS